MTPLDTVGDLAATGRAIASAVEAYAPPVEVRTARGLARVDAKRRGEVGPLIERGELLKAEIAKIHPRHWRKRARKVGALLRVYADLVDLGVDLGDLQRYREDLAKWGADVGG